MRFKKEYEGQTPRAPRHLGFVYDLDDVPCREAAIEPAARRTCPKFALKHEADINGVWGPRPQENFLTQIIVIIIKYPKAQYKMRNFRE